MASFKMSLSFCFVCLLSSLSFPIALNSAR